MSGVDDQPKKTLRIALAMRGGVSMAVWIGGAVAELDLLRRAAAGVAGCTCEGDQLLVTPVGRAPEIARAHLYRRMLAQRRYGRVEFDILAGASAGGLNAVLFALAQSYGVVTDDIVAPMWSEDGDLWKLIRSPGWGPVASLLKGDDGFLTLAEKTLSEIVDRGLSQETPGLRHDHLTVELAATLLTDWEQPQIGNRAGFSFTRRPGGLASAYSTIPGHSEADANARIALRRMALAARATSSFPGAFEPASVYSVAGGPDGGVIGEKSDIVNMVSVFPFARERGDLSVLSRLNRECDRFNIVDGGVFDNIPIDRALRAIQRAPASDPSERHLLYLDPQPPPPAEPPSLPRGLRRGANGAIEDESPGAIELGWRKLLRSLGRSNSGFPWLSSVFDAKSLQKRQESAEDEVAQIWRHNITESAVRGRLNAFAGLVTGPELSEATSADGYIEYRIGAETERLSQLFADPVSHLCCRPDDSRPYDSVDNASLVNLRTSVETAYGIVASGTAAQPSTLSNETAADARTTFSAGDLAQVIDVTQILITWVQRLQSLPGVEPRPGDAPAGDLAELKAGLYRCLAVAHAARRLAVDKFLVETCSVPLIDRIVKSVARQQDVCVIADVVDSLDVAAPAARIAEFYPRLACGDHRGVFMVGEVPPPSQASRSLLAAVREKLDEYVVAVQQWTPGTGGTEQPTIAAWSQSLFAALAGQNVTRAGLAHLCARSGVPGTASTVSYATITGDRRPRINIEALTKAAVDDQLQAWLRAGTDPGKLDDDRLTGAITQAEHLGRADTKLAGTILARFGGFLSAGWRENDWYWGRLDAADGIVGLLEPGDDRTGGRLQELIWNSDAVDLCRQGEQSPCSGRKVSEVINDAAGESFAHVPINYRFGVIARCVPLALRALWPAESAGGGLVGIGTRGALLLVRPLVPVVSLAGDLLRLVAAVGIAMLAAVLLGAGPTRVGGQWVFAAVMAIMSGLLIVRAMNARGRWKVLQDFVRGTRLAPETPANWREHVNLAWPRARLRISGSIVLGAVVLLGLAAWVVVVLLRDDADKIFGIGFEFMAMAVVCMGLAVWSLNSAALTIWTKKPKRGKTRWFVLGATWVVFTAITAIAYAGARYGNCLDGLDKKDGVGICERSYSGWFARVFGYSDSQNAPLVAAVAVALLVVVSLGWWAKWWYVLVVSVALAIVAAILQWWLEAASNNAGILDLLPVAVWMIGMGLFQQLAPPQGLQKVARQ